GKELKNYRIVDKMQICRQKAGIPYDDKTLNKKGEHGGIVFHSLRHTRVTKWVEAGFSDEIIRRATGHKDLGAYRNYIKLDASAVMRLVEKITDNSRIKTTDKAVR
ncbi:MAG: hypothetical protein MUO52_04495, partial [Desulfobacterales bacterium]|nr:hypothetical protein [Desulfobacterales bacterium]